MSKEEVLEEAALQVRTGIAHVYYPGRAGSYFVPALPHIDEEAALGVHIATRPPQDVIL